MRLHTMIDFNSICSSSSRIAINATINFFNSDVSNNNNNDNETISNENSYYIQPPIIGIVHKLIPRWWMTSGDINLVITGTDHDYQQYMIALLCNAVILFAVFIIWIILLLYFHKSGYNKVGLLSGHPYRISARLRSYMNRKQQQIDELGSNARSYMYQSAATTTTTTDTVSDSLRSSSSLSTRWLRSSVSTTSSTSFRTRLASDMSSSSSSFRNNITNLPNRASAEQSTTPATPSPRNQYLQVVETELRKVLDATNGTKSQSYSDIINQHRQQQQQQEEDSLNYATEDATSYSEFDMLHQPYHDPQLGVNDDDDDGNDNASNNEDDDYDDENQDDVGPIPLFVQVSDRVVHNSPISSCSTTSSEHQQTSQRSIQYRIRPKFDPLKAIRAKLRRYRIIVLVSGNMVVVATIVLLIYSFTQLMYGTKIVDNQLELASTYATNVQDQLSHYKEHSHNNNAIEQFVMDHLNAGYCPKLHSPLCVGSNILLNRSDDKFDDCYFANVPLGESSVRQLFDSVIPSQNDVETNKTISFLEGNAIDWSILNTIFEGLNKALQPFQVTFYVTTTLSIVILLITLILLYFSTMTLFYGKNYKHHCNKFLQVMAGLLAFIMLLSCIICVILVIGSTMSTDFCYDNPDTTIQSYIDTTFANVQGGILNQTKTWISNHSTISNPEHEFRQWMTTIANNLDRIHTFENEIYNFAQTNDFAMICGSNPDYWINTSSQLLYDDTTTNNNGICDSVQTISDIISSISYPTWNPIYIDTIHIGLCHYGAIGFTIVTFSQFCIVLFGMIMLTFRAGFYEIE